MNEKTIDGLLEALSHSPDNISLRYMLADNLLLLGRLDDAEEHYAKIVGMTDETKAKIGLAQVYLKKAKYSACNVILEQILEREPRHVEVLILHAKALLRENSINKAISIYERALAIDPNGRDDELDSHLRMRGHSDVDMDDQLDYLDETDDRFLEKPDVDFSDVGGMDGVKKEIDMKIIKPLQHPELYKAYGKTAGGGILLYGPPGCGKTFIAKATAGEVKAKFISVGLTDILDMWIGSSEKNLHSIFELARNHTPCVLFIDEIDALGASRSNMKHTGGSMIINQFLQELDGIENSNENVLIIGATNTPWSLDTAFRRPGRFDRIIFVPPPDAESREAILGLKLKDKPTGIIDIHGIAKRTKNYSGADLDAVIDIAIEAKIESSFSDGIPKPLETKDLIRAVKKHTPSTQEWFATAKNYAMFANESGLYDSILNYIKANK